MAIGNIWTLTPDVVQIMYDAIDDMIFNWGKDCQLIFPGPIIPCNNCVFDSIGRRNMNAYRTGGPIPFGQGQVCPVCNGKGTINAPEVTKIIHMVLRWNPAHFAIANRQTDIQMPFGIIETEGWIKDVPDILQSRVMIAQLPLQPIINARFELFSQPVDPHTFSQGQSFVAHWKRLG